MLNLHFILTLILLAAAVRGWPVTDTPEDNLENDIVEMRRLRPHESHRGCRQGCHRGHADSEVDANEAGDYSDSYPREWRPRPIYGLISDIIETARYGYRIDKPRNHFLF
ncbi:hypothetical protein J6590_070377 [Homalodisca vitripennis]|nr:hypothetical protein J6590_070377 [Homalodisca vitripennis]